MKGKVLTAVIQKLESDLQVQIKAAKDAHEAATHSESAAETKWDTFGLESSYLAQGQQKRVSEIAESIDYFKNLKEKPAKNSPGDLVETGSLVQLGSDCLTLWFFLAAQAGGLKVEVDGQTVTVLTVHSPVGRQLLDKSIGDIVDIPLKGKVEPLELMDIG